jgi:tetratricopeptide (TPR) repeat protein
LLTSAQESEIQITSSVHSQKADSLFKNGNYSQAIVAYQNLLNLYPNDANIQYALGVSYLLATRNSAKAIDLLKRASTKEVSNQVYFYLAEAYLHGYEFDNAINYYRRYTINSGIANVSKSTIEQRLNWCENGTFMLKYLYQPTIVDKKIVSASDFYSSISTASPNGAFVPKPNDLKTSIDKKESDASTIFFPVNPQVGDRVFYSSYGSTTSQGKDIFVIERLADGFWSKPKNIGDPINTTFDEDFPYLAPDGTLYFASKGHYSMGGYDIYRSVFNSITNTWSEPENLGFPFSSPFDDFLYVVNPDNTLVSFVTSRNVMPDSLEVVTVEVDPNPIRRAVTSLDIVREVAKLNVELGKSSEQTSIIPINKSQISKTQKTASGSAVENDTEYSRALAKGFAEQMKTDSLRIRLEALRARFDNISTAEERRKLEAQVVKVEDELLSAQHLADTHFARASQIEQEYITGKRKPAEKIAENYAVDNPQFLYQARYATSVFHSEELKRLANIEKNATLIDKQRKEILQLKKSISDKELDEAYKQSQNFKNDYSTFVAKIKGLLPVYTEFTATKKKLYSDCISVAMVKQAASDRKDIRSEIDKANLHFRSAMAIRNNIDPNFTEESQFDALLLEELGVLRFELTFAKLWGLNLFEQSILSSIIRLEQSVFGKSLVQTQVQVKESATVIQEKFDTIAPQKVNAEVASAADAIMFKPEVNPEFQIVEVSPYGLKNPIPIDEALPQGVLYRIQLGAYSNPVSIQSFKGMTPISGEKVSGGKITKYYVGKFFSLSNAEKALPSVKGLGFKDAFIVAWHNGRSVALSRAQSLEKHEQTNPPSETRIEIQPENSELVYVISLGSFKGRLPDDVSQTVRTLAPGKDIIRKPDSQGGFIYSVGNFKSLTEVNRVKDNLIGSGIGGAKVVTVEIE